MWMTVLDGVVVVPMKWVCLLFYSNFDLSTVYRAELVGIHASVTRCIPLFFIYLATLTHTYGLATRRSPGPTGGTESCDHPSNPVADDRVPGAEMIPNSRGDVPEDEGRDIEAGDALTQWVAEEEHLPQQEVAASGPERLGGMVGDTVTGLVSRTWTSVLSAVAALYEFVGIACTAAERPPHFIIVEVKHLLPLDTTSAPQSRQQGEEITRLLQAKVDAIRAQHLSESQHRLEANGAAVLGVHEAGELSTTALPRAAADTTQAPPQQRSEHHAISGGIDLSTMGPLRLRFDRFLPAGAAIGHATTAHTPRAADKPPPPPPSRPSSPEGGARLLLEVLPEKSTPHNSPGVCTFPGWPAKARHPAATAAAVLLQPPGSGSVAVEVAAAEHFSRNAHDWYAATAFLDILAFLYVAMYYNKVVSGAAGSLSDITTEHVVPLGYLLTLMTLFMFIVLDRVAYTLGSSAGKTALHTLCVLSWLTFPLHV
jgi:hypothetical protein